MKEKGVLTSAVLATSSQKISHLMSPRFVCKVTDCNTQGKYRLVVGNALYVFDKITQTELTMLSIGSDIKIEIKGVSLGLSKCLVLSFRGSKA